MIKDAHHRVSRTAGALHITLSRPDAGNRVSMSLLQALTQVLAAVDADPDVNVITLQGEGEDFCLGRDPGGEQTGDPSASALHARVIEPILRFYRTMELCPVPVVSRVQGRALGFGCALAAACDVTLAADSARFALPELLKGIPPTLAMSALQPFVGRKALTHLVYSGQEIDALSAQRIGLVSEVVKAEALEGEAAALVAAMAARPRAINAAVKEYARTGPMADATTASRFAGLLMAVARA